MKLSQQLKNYPCIMIAVEEIAYDNGMINRYAPIHELHLIPARYCVNNNSILRLIETQLSVLTTTELRLFCAGEQTIIEELRDKYGLHMAHAMLNDWFES